MVRHREKKWLSCLVVFCCTSPAISEQTYEWSTTTGYVKTCRHEFDVTGENWGIWKDDRIAIDLTLPRSSVPYSPVEDVMVPNNAPWADYNRLTYDYDICGIPENKAIRLELSDVSGIQNAFLQIRDREPEKKILYRTGDHVKFIGTFTGKTASATLRSVEGTYEIKYNFATKSKNDIKIPIDPSQLTRVDYGSRQNIRHDFMAVSPEITLPQGAELTAEEWYGSPIDALETSLPYSVSEVPVFAVLVNGDGNTTAHTTVDIYDPDTLEKVQIKVKAPSQGFGTDEYRIGIGDPENPILLDGVPMRVGYSSGYTGGVPYDGPEEPVTDRFLFSNLSPFGGLQSSNEVIATKENLKQGQCVRFDKVRMQAGSFMAQYNLTVNGAVATKQSYWFQPPSTRICPGDKLVLHYDPRGSQYEGRLYIQHKRNGIIREMNEYWEFSSRN